MSAALPLLSPLVTRILELKGFPSELKTRDIQAIFAAWEEERGGFKIKWVDDTTALVIFADPVCAKRAYLQVLMSPPPMLMNSNGTMAKVRPYDGEDAGHIISSVQSRPRSRSNAGLQAIPAYGGGSTAVSDETTGGGTPPSSYANGATAITSPRSVAAARPPGAAALGHRRNPSGSNPSNLPPKPLAAALYDAANGGPSPAHHLANAMAADAAAAAVATAEVAAATQAQQAAAAAAAASSSPGGGAIDGGLTTGLGRSGSWKNLQASNSSSPLAHHHRLQPSPSSDMARATPT